MIWVWVALVVISAIVEAATWYMASIWVTCGSLIALILCAIGVPVIWQVIVFLSISILCIIFLRPLLKKFIKNKTYTTNISSFIGQKAILLEKVNRNLEGSLKINGIVWTAISDSEKDLDIGQEVEIIEILGNKLKVRPVELNNKENIKNIK